MAGIAVLAGDRDVVLIRALPHLGSPPFPHILGVIGMGLDSDQQLPERGETPVALEPEVQLLELRAGESVVEKRPERNGDDDRQYDEQHLPAEVVDRHQDRDEQDGGDGKRPTLLLLTPLRIHPAS